MKKIVCVPVCLSIYLCQVKGTLFFPIFQRKSWEGFFETQITDLRSTQLEILLLVKEKVKLKGCGPFFKRPLFRRDFTRRAPIAPWIARNPVARARKTDIRRLGTIFSED